MPSFFFGTATNTRIHRRSRLKTRLKSYILLASFLAAGKRKEALVAMKKGLESGVMKQRAVGELLLHLSLLLGFPLMLEGLAMLRSITGKSDSTVPKKLTAMEIRRRGMKVMDRVYGKTLDRLLVNVKALHRSAPDLIIREAYGRIIGRPGLSLRDREILNVAVLTIQQLDQQLYSHIRGALRLHVSPSDLRAAILLASKVAGRNPSLSLHLLASLAKT